MRHPRSVLSRCRYDMHARRTHIASAIAANYALVIVSVAIIGAGSSVFHPRSITYWQMASGGRKGLAQSIYFRVGGNGGSAIDPLLAALIVLPSGQRAILWFRCRHTLRPRRTHAHRQMVRPRHSHARSHRSSAVAGLPVFPRKNSAQSNDHTRADDILQVLLHIVYDELLHILPHRTLRRQRARLPVLPLHLPRSRSHRHSGRRRHRRSIWPQICDTAIHTRLRALRLGTALHQPCMDNIAFAVIIGLVISSRHSLRHSSLCHRPHARQSRNGCRHILRPYVRPRRHRLGIFRLARRPHKHRIHIPSQHPYATARHHRSMAPQHKTTTLKTKQKATVLHAFNVWSTVAIYGKHLYQSSSIPTP